MRLTLMSLNGILMQFLYNIGYYGYMWSKVFSSDMFFSKFEKDTLSAEAGFSYRKNVLEKGSSRYNY